MLCQAYLTHLPREFMRVVAGFSSSSGDYFLARGTHEPPYALQKQLWPWIEEWEPRFEARARRCNWAQGGLDENDLAADGFLKLMRHLRVVLLQDLAVLQPRYSTLPFFAHAPFYGPEWDEFALLVQADAVGASEPQSLLLQRALPELSGVLQSTREAILQNTQHLVGRLEGRLKSQLQGLQGSLDALLHGQVPITTVTSVTSYFGTEPPGASTAPAPAPPAPVPALAPALATPMRAPASPAEPGPPVSTGLARVYTVKDAWREWQEGLAGQPAIRELEERWGSRWRPGNTLKVQFCRRKVIWDAVRVYIARGKTEEEAIAELEQLRNGRSLNRLVDELRQRRQRQQERQQEAPRLQSRRGQSRRGRARRAARGSRGGRVASRAARS